MKTIRSISIVVLIIFTAVNVAAYAQMHEKGQKFKEHMYKELNLTPEQQAKLEANRKVEREKMQQTFTVLREKQTKLQEALSNPGATKASIEPIVNEMKLLQAQMIDNRVNGILEVKKILTPDQFAKFTQKMQGLKEKMQGRMQKHWGDRENPPEQGLGE